MSVAEVRYCTVYDVAQVMGVKVDRFDEESWPAKETVDMLIRYYMDYVDRYTRMAWRERWNYEVEGGTKVDAESGYEMHKLIPIGFTGWLWQGRPVVLRYRPVRPFDITKGDSLQVFTGSGWEEWLDGSKVMGPHGDFWVDYTAGMIFFRRVWWFSKLQGWTVRVRYRFGFTSVPDTIRYATALLVAAHLVESGDYNMILPEGAQNIVFAREKAMRWTERAHEILAMYKNVATSD